MQLDYYIENTVTEIEFENAVLKYLSEGDYTPDDIFEAIDSNKNLHLLPFFYFLKEYKGNAFAEGGADRRESYVMNNQTYYRTATDWFPISQYIEGEVDAVIYAGESYHKSITDFFEELRFNYKDLKEVKVIDAYFDKLSRLFEKDKFELWKNQGVYTAYEKVKNISRGKVRAKYVRNFDVEVRFSDKESFSMVYPFWIFNYQYNNENFVVLVDGVNKERIAGSRPIDQKKKRFVSDFTKGIWIIGLFFSFLFAGIAFYFTKQLWWIPTSIFSGGIILTAIFRGKVVKNVKQQSKLNRQNKLKQIQEKQSPNR